jgi:hypothetical protein
VTPVDILIEAAGLISDPADWCQHTAQRVTADGHEQICLRTAIFRAAGITTMFPNREHPAMVAAECADRAAIQLGMPPGPHNPSFSPAAIWQDTHSHAETMELCDLAIRFAKERGE